MRDDDITPGTNATPHVPEPREIDEHQATEPAAMTAPPRHERDLDLPLEEAWPLLSTREGLEQWLGDRVELEIDTGELGTIRDGDELLHTEVESIEPGRRLSLRWWSEERGAAVVDLTLEPLDDERSRLVVIEVPVRALVVPSVAPIKARTQRPTGPQLRAPRALAVA